jgi:hypothetical protein
MRRAAVDERYFPSPTNHSVEWMEPICLPGWKRQQCDIELGRQSSHWYRSVGCVPITSQKDAVVGRNLIPVIFQATTKKFAFHRPGLRMGMPIVCSIADLGLPGPFRLTLGDEEERLFLLTG